jgi:hypothetical protein
MKPTKSIYDLGQNENGQLLTLEVGASLCVLTQHAANSRDESVSIFLTPRLAALLLADPS